MKKYYLHILSVTLAFFTFPSLNAQNSIVNTFHSIKEKVVKIICYDIDKSGTGFIIDQDGYLLTNNHVVAKYTIENDRLTSVIYSDSIYAIFENNDTLRFTSNI